MIFRQNINWISAFERRDDDGRCNLQELLVQQNSSLIIILVTSWWEFADHIDGSLQSWIVRHFQSNDSEWWSCKDSLLFNYILFVVDVAQQDLILIPWMHSQVTMDAPLISLLNGLFRTIDSPFFVVWWETRRDTHVAGLFTLWVWNCIRGWSRFGQANGIQMPLDEHKTTQLVEILRRSFLLVFAIFRYVSLK